jgi:hypothetical protein
MLVRARLLFECPVAGCCTHLQDAGAGAGAIAAGGEGPRNA